MFMMVDYVKEMTVKKFCKANMDRFSMPSSCYTVDLIFWTWCRSLETKTYKRKKQTPGDVEINGCGLNPPDSGCSGLVLLCRQVVMGRPLPSPFLLCRQVVMGRPLPSPFLLCRQVVMGRPLFLLPFCCVDRWSWVVLFLLPFCCVDRWSWVVLSSFSLSAVQTGGHGSSSLPSPFLLCRQVVMGRPLFLLPFCCVDRWSWVALSSFTMSTVVLLPWYKLCIN